MFANSTAYLAGDVVVQGISVVLFPIYTRAMAPAEFGILGVALTVSSLLTIALSLAVPGAITRLHFEATDEDDRRTLYGTVLIFTVAVPGLATLGLDRLGAAGLLDVVDAVPFDPYLRIAIWVAFLSGILQVPVNIFTVQERPRPVLALTIANAVLIAFGTLLLVVVLDQEAKGALIAMLVAAGAVALASVVLTLRAGALRFSWRWARAAVGYGLPLLPHALSQWILFVSDRLILTRYVTNAQVGFYSLGATVGSLASFVVNAMNRAGTPAVMDELKQPRHAPDFVPRLGTYWIGALMTCCVLLAVFGDDAIVLLTPPTFHEAVRVVPWVVLGFFFMGTYTVLAQGTYFSMRTQWVPLATIAAGGVNVGLNFLLIPEHGFVAAAWTTAIGFAALALLHGLLAAKLHHIRWELVRWAKLTTAGVLAYVLAEQLEGGAVGWLLQGLVVAVSLPILTAVLRVLDAQERQWIGKRIRIASRRPAP